MTRPPLLSPNGLVAAAETILIDQPRDEAESGRPARARAARRRETLAEHAQTIGVATSIEPRSFDEVLSYLSSRTAKSITILVQPAHPLERQIPSFRRLSIAVSRSETSVVYMPGRFETNACDILVLDPNEPGVATLFANSLLARDRTGNIVRSTARSLRDLRHDLMRTASASPFALVVLTRDAITATPDQFMKLTAL